MKKQFLWTCIISLLLIFLARFVIVLVFHYTSMWACAADFEEYGDDFDTVKDYFAEQYPDEYGKWFMESYDSGNDQHRIYDPDTKKYLQLPDDVQASLETVCRYGFPNKDSSLDTIWIYGDRISFRISNNRYELVYSPNERPSYLGFPDEDEDIKVKKIGDGWYHVRVS